MLEMWWNNNDFKSFQKKLKKDTIEYCEMIMVQEWRAIQGNMVKHLWEQIC